MIRAEPMFAAWRAQPVDRVHCKRVVGYDPGGEQRADENQNKKPEAKSGHFALGEQREKLAQVMVFILHYRAFTLGSR